MVCLFVLLLGLFVCLICLYVWFIYLLVGLFLFVGLLVLLVGKPIVGAMESFKHEFWSAQAMPQQNKWTSANNSSIRENIGEKQKHLWKVWPKFAWLELEHQTSLLHIICLTSSPAPQNDKPASVLPGVRGVWIVGWQNLLLEFQPYKGIDLFSIILLNREDQQQKHDHHNISNNCNNNNNNNYNYKDNKKHTKNYKNK